MTLTICEEKSLHYLDDREHLKGVGADNTKDEGDVDEKAHHVVCRQVLGDDLIRVLTKLDVANDRQRS